MANSEVVPEESLYPHIEQMVETATVEEVDAFLASVKEGLGNLKGPQVEKSKKVELAIAHTEELLKHLLEVRSRLESEGKSKT